MSFSNIVDKLLDQHSFPDASTTEQTNLSTTGDRKSTRLNSSHVLRSRMPSSA